MSSVRPNNQRNFLRISVLASKKRLDKKIKALQGLFNIIIYNTKVFLFELFFLEARAEILKKKLFIFKFKSFSRKYGISLFEKDLITYLTGGFYKIIIGYNLNTLDFIVATTSGPTWAQVGQQLLFTSIIGKMRQFSLCKRKSKKCSIPFLIGLVFCCIVD